MPNLKIFVINLQRAKSRRTAMSLQLDAMQIPYEFFTAVDGQELTSDDLAMYSSAETIRIHGRELTRNEIGCAISHLSIYKRLIESSYDECLIFEDDVQIGQMMWEVLSARNKLPVDWEFINFITDASEIPFGAPIVDIYRVTRFEESANRCSANLVHRRGALKLLAAAYPIRYAADGLTGITANTQLVSYGIYPRVATLADVPSTIWGNTSELLEIHIVAFCLWGDNPIYLQGALCNAELASVHYPDWICRFYCASDLNPSVLQALQNLSNTEVVLMPPAPDRAGAFWRFLASEDTSVSHVIFRDTDSRLGAREAAAVREWIASDKPFHLMRDHPFHWPAVMAGMWGCKGGALTGWQSAMSTQSLDAAYGGDQSFLAERIYPLIRKQCLIHDSIGLSEQGLDIRSFPTEREGLAFVGQSFDERDQPNAHYAQELAKHINPA